MRRWSAGPTRRSSGAPRAISQSGLDELERGHLPLPEASLRIASIEHLVLVKRGAGRPQYLADIEALEKLKQYLDEDVGK